MGIGEGSLEGTMDGKKVGMKLGFELGANVIDGKILGIELGPADGEIHDGKNILMSNNFKFVSYVRNSNSMSTRLGFSMTVKLPDHPSVPS